MTSCQICLEPYDHSIRKPYSLSSCPHTYCLSCLQKLPNKKCPQCTAKIKRKNLNIALLDLIPESNYDKLKAVTLKAIIQLNETKTDLKKNRQINLNVHQTNLTSMKKIIGDETNKLIDILKKNEEILTNECDTMLANIKASLDSNKYENKSGFEIALDTRDAVEKNKLNEDELKNLNKKISEINQQLNQLSDVVKLCEYNYKYISNIISLDTLLIGKIINEKLNNETNNDSIIDTITSNLDYLNIGDEKNLNNSNLYKESIQNSKNQMIENNKNKRKRKSSIAFYNKGIYFIELEKYKEAVECFDEAIRLNAKDLSYYIEKGIALKNLGKYEEAIDCLDIAIKINPNDSDSYNVKATSLFIIKKFKEALECLDKLIELNPNHPYAYDFKGDVLLHLKMDNEAIKCFDKVIEIIPKNSDTYNKKGVCLNGLKRYEEAIECFDKAIKINPIYAQSIANKSIALENLKKREEAFQFFKQNFKFV